MTVSVAGVEITREVDGRHAEVVSAEAVEFVARLQREFN